MACCHDMLIALLLPAVTDTHSVNIWLLLLLLPRFHAAAFRR